MEIIRKPPLQIEVKFKLGDIHKTLSTKLMSRTRQPNSVLTVFPMISAITTPIYILVVGIFSI